MSRGSASSARPARIAWSQTSSMRFCRASLPTPGFRVEPSGPLEAYRRRAVPEQNWPAANVIVESAICRLPLLTECHGETRVLAESGQPEAVWLAFIAD